MKHAKGIAAGLVIGLLVAGGTAWAAWTLSGSGNAAAKAGTAAAVTVAPGSVNGDMYPGGSGQVKVVVTNPNNYTAQVTAISVTGSVTSSDQANCAGATYLTVNISGAPDTGSFGNLGANQSVTLAWSAGATLASNAPTACAGQTFTIPVTVTASVGS